MLKAANPGGIFTQQSTAGKNELFLRQHRLEDTAIVDGPDNRVKELIKPIVIIAFVQTPVQAVKAVNRENVVGFIHRVHTIALYSIPWASATASFVIDPLYVFKAPKYKGSLSTLSIGVEARCST